MAPKKSKLASALSTLDISGDGGPLSYECHAMLAMSRLLAGSLDAAALHAGSALRSAADPDLRAYIGMLPACIWLRRGDAESAVRCLDGGTSGNERLRALASFYAGIVRYKLDEFEDALAHFEAAGGGKGIFDGLAIRCNVGACAVNMGDMDPGKREFDVVALLVSKKSGSRAARQKLLADSYMGIISRVRGEYSEAEGYYKQAISSCVRLNDSTGIANSRRRGRQQRQESLKRCALLPVTSASLMPLPRSILSVSGTPS